MLYKLIACIFVGQYLKISHRKESHERRYSKAGQLGASSLSLDWDYEEGRVFTRKAGCFENHWVIHRRNHTLVLNWRSSQKLRKFNESVYCELKVKMKVMEVV